MSKYSDALDEIEKIKAAIKNLQDFRHAQHCFVGGIRIWEVREHSYSIETLERAAEDFVIQACSKELKNLLLLAERCAEEKIKTIKRNIADEAKEVLKGI